MKVSTNVLFGYVELKQFTKFEDGRMTTYGFRIDYDLDGNETRRTEPEILGSIGWNDGSPFTETDYRKIIK